MKILRGAPSSAAWVVAFGRHFVTHSIRCKLFIMQINYLTFYTEYIEMYFTIMHSYQV